MAINSHRLFFGYMRRFWLGIFISSTVGILYFFYFFYSEEGYLPTVTKNYHYLLTSLVTANIAGLMIYRSDLALNRLLPWKENLSTRLIVGMLVNALIAIAIILVICWIFLGLQTGSFVYKGLWTSYYEPLVKLMVITLMAVVLYSLIYFALFSYNEYAVVHIDAVKNHRRQLAVQFEALKSQLSPHYLFNSLNTISSLIFKDPNMAEDFIRRLAQTYQYILDNNEKQYITLREEVEFVKSYNYLLKVRFENNLHIEINLPPNVLDTKMPPLTLQMLVENAVKHNVISKEQPLHIYISAIDNTDIKVTNTKTKAPAHVTSFHIGLDNIKKRYSFFTNKAIKVENSNKFTVRLPVIRDEFAKTA
ncbi:hypothetical protein C900_01589 [Fulvivirga imtechensis AK7]|uniref:Signal transduction histidine kinase internal region domain-containing protein n=1 Tax=Fulvivirga imtechensis AK7 TaxID=1237149 RepID=L8JYN4_9BACT|nr:histidine kinase [Fulvivirga imtechensis]ELR72307.1 hypothetical protein C900_01589 [Fulvivirga imtechensis AK7]